LVRDVWDEIQPSTEVIFPMKRFLIAVAAVTVCTAFADTSPLSAQRALGFRAGASIADLSIEVNDDVAPDLSSRTGFIVGAYMDIPLNSSLFFQPGFGLTQKGAKINDDDDTFELRLDYLEIPLLLKYAFPTSGSVGFHLMAGPALAWELTCRVGIEAEGFSDDVDCGEEDVEIETKSIDFGVLLGGGVSFPMGGVRLTAEGFYNIGMSNILDDAGVEDSAKNRALYLTVGVAFPIG
jgi:hypothetical protein